MTNDHRARMIAAVTQAGVPDRDWKTAIGVALAALLEEQGRINSTVTDLAERTPTKEELQHLKVEMKGDQFLKELGRRVIVGAKALVALALATAALWTGYEVIGKMANVMKAGAEK